MVRGEGRGARGAVLLPTHYAVGRGKDGNIYLADVNNMGHVGHFAQQFAAQSSGNTVGASPVYWQGSNRQYIFASHSNGKTNLPDDSQREGVCGDQQQCGCVGIAQIPLYPGGPAKRGVELGRRKLDGDNQPGGTFFSIVWY